MTTEDAVKQVHEEREKQKVMWGGQENTPHAWLGILAEEFGKLALAINESNLDMARHPELGGAENIRREACHTAAIAIAIMEELG